MCLVNAPEVGQEGDDLQGKQFPRGIAGPNESHHLGEAAVHPLPEEASPGRLDVLWGGLVQIGRSVEHLYQSSNQAGDGPDLLGAGILGIWPQRHRAERLGDSAVRHIGRRRECDIVQVQYFPIRTSDIFGAESLEEIFYAPAEGLAIGATKPSANMGMTVYQRDDHLVFEAGRLRVPDPADDRNDLVRDLVHQDNVVCSDDVQDEVQGREDVLVSAGIGALRPEEAQERVGHDLHVGEDGCIGGGQQVSEAQQQLLALMSQSGGALLRAAGGSGPSRCD